VKDSNKFPHLKFQRIHRTIRKKFVTDSTRPHEIWK